MTRAFLLTPAFLLAACGLAGCGYTILRDLDEEAWQAEVAAAASLVTAPDLMISNIEYEYIPPQPRRIPYDRMSRPAKVEFYITVTNIGNTEFASPYLLVLKDCDPYSEYARKVRGIRQNSRRERIPPDSTLEITFTTDYPSSHTLYSFTIVTNPIIQRDVVQDLKRYTHNPPLPPLSRELRYDNNESSIDVHGRLNRLYGGQNIAPTEIVIYKEQ
jgi:hypothetical protein